MDDDYIVIGWDVYDYARSQYKLKQISPAEGVISMGLSLMLACLHQNLTPKSFNEVLEQIKGNYPGLFDLARGIKKRKK